MCSIIAALKDMDSEAAATIVGAFITAVATIIGLAVGLVVSFRQFRKQQKADQDQQAKRYTEFIKGLEQRKKESDTRQRAADSQLEAANKRPFLLKKLELCFQASEVVSTLATETNAEKWKKAQANFWRLYWGPLSAVENPQVEAAMYELGKIVPKPDEQPGTLPMTDSLKYLSYGLAHEVRALVLKSRGVELESLNKLAAKANPKEADETASKVLGKDQTT
ncbi:MAG: hypothetical protein ABSG46_15360 [Candidatus Binataceae bacterium]